MTIHPRPDQEQIIQRAIRAGLIASAEEALEVGLPNLRERLDENTAGRSPQREKTLLEVFEPVRGLGDDLDVARNPSTGRPVEL